MEHDINLTGLHGSDRDRMRARLWYANNKERSREYHKKYYAKNFEKRKEQDHKRYIQNKAQLLEQSKQRQKEHRIEINAQLNRRYHTDPQYNIAVSIRNRLYRAIKLKAKSTLKLVGCSWAELVKHIESLFQPGMTWENHGEWHIDHIRPLASFDLTQEEEQVKACHWSNLQPLWAKDNLEKNAKYND
jgi:hypothetical protein